MKAEARAQIAQRINNLANGNGGADSAEAIIDSVYRLGYTDASEHQSLRMEALGQAVEFRSGRSGEASKVIEDAQAFHKYLVAEDA